MHIPSLLSPLSPSLPSFRNLGRSLGAGTGWNDIVKAGLDVTNVVRTSDTEVTITLPAFANYAIGSAETVTATVPASALVTSEDPLVAGSFDVNPDGGGGGGATVVFHSDWGTLTGTSDDALRDTAKTDPWEIAVPNDALSVVDAVAEGLTGWPTTNALRVRLPSSTSAWLRISTQATSPIPIPAIGEWLYYRWYHGLWTPDGTAFEDRQHVVEQNIGGFSGTNGNWAWRVDTGQSITPVAGEWMPSWIQQQTDPVVTLFAPANLDKETLYRWEIAQHRTSTTEYEVFLRVYDINDTLVYDATDFEASPSTNLFNDINETQELQIGINGFPADATYPFTWGYYGGVAVALGDAAGQWIGPYAGGI